MQGYRTIIVNAVMMLTGEGTVQFTDLPPDAQHWLSMLIMAWGLLVIFMRLITKTPIGQKMVAVVEQELGLTPAQAQAIRDDVMQQVMAMVATMPAGAVPQSVLSAIKPVPAPVAPDIARITTLVSLPQEPPLLPQNAAPLIPPQNIAAPPPAQQQATAPAAAQG